MTKTERRIKFIQDFGHLILFAQDSYIEFIITHVYRTAEEQKKLYNLGLTDCDGYNTRSKHQDWLAIDICIIKDNECVWDRTPEYEALGDEWKEMGHTWGGDFKSRDDVYHFEE